LETAKETRRTVALKGGKQSGGLPLYKRKKIHCTVAEGVPGKKKEKILDRPQYMLDHVEGREKSK